VGDIAQNVRPDLATTLSHASYLGNAPTLRFYWAHRKICSLKFEHGTDLITKLEGVLPWTKFSLKKFQILKPYKFWIYWLQNYLSHLQPSSSLRKLGTNYLNFVSSPNYEHHDVFDESINTGPWCWCQVASNDNSQWCTKWDHKRCMHTKAIGWNICNYVKCIHFQLGIFWFSWWDLAGLSRKGEDPLLLSKSLMVYLKFKI